MIHLWTALAGIALLAAVFIPLERLHLRRRQPVARPEVWTDCAFFFGQAWLWTPLATAILVMVATTVAALPLAGLWGTFGAQPWWLQAVEILVLGDLVVYWGHRAAHRVPALWALHRVHHTAEHLDWIAAFREHPLDGLYTQLCLNLPALILGFDLSTIAGVAAFRGMWGVYIHSNVRLSPGPLKLLVGAPELHHWHHDRHRGGSCNFANLMPLMDLVFGTYHDPVADPGPPGLDEASPRSWWGLILTPWRRDQSPISRRASASATRALPNSRPRAPAPIRNDRGSNPM